MTITWRKEGDYHFGEEPETHHLDAMTWRVDGRRLVYFRVPGPPPYFFPAVSPVTAQVVLDSLDEHLKGQQP